MNNSATMLQFDWAKVEGLAVAAVLATGSRAMDDGSLVCDQLMLVLGAQAVVMRVNDDTDEVIVSLEDAAITKEANWQRLDQLADIVSRRLGWCWVGRNYRGYLDTFMIGLDGIDPAYSFTGAASALQCTRVTPILA
jgi:hypothetical protein